MRRERARRITGCALEPAASTAPAAAAQDDPRPIQLAEYVVRWLPGHELASGTPARYRATVEHCLPPEILAARVVDLDARKLTP
jgi:hypothetical protein